MGIGIVFGLAFLVIIVIGLINWKLSGSKRIFEPWTPRMRNSSLSVGLSERFRNNNINYSNDHKDN